MGHLVFAIFILLSVFSKEAATAQGATPPPLTFDCSGGKITKISGSNISMNSLLVEIGANGKVCHYSGINCNWQNQQILRVIYEPDEKDLKSKFVAGKIYRYLLECKTGYLAQATVAAFAINNLTTKPYYHQNVTGTPPPNAIHLTISKKGETAILKETVFVGDPLELKITGPASHSLKPVKCEAYNKDSIGNKYTLWDNTGCKSHDEAIMSNSWTTKADNSIAIDMFAFRFVDSLSITIECSAYVCPLNDPTCDKSTHDCLNTAAPTTTTPTGGNGVTAAPLPGGNGVTAAPPPAPFGTTKTKRRRRSNTRNDYKEKNASTSFTVVDVGSESSGCAGLSSNITLYLTTLFVCLLIFGRDSLNHGK